MKDGRRDSSTLRGMAEDEAGRADRAANVAYRHEGLAETATVSMRAFHRRMAGIHRSTERVHRTSAELHLAHADYVDRSVIGGRRPPTRFIATVAEVADSPSTAVTLFGRNADTTVVATSDPIAEAACDFEYVFGEGPSWTPPTTSTPLRVCGQEELTRRWPQFGPAAHDLGVRAVVVAPLGLPERPLGTLTAYRSDTDPAPEVARAVGTAAAALTTTALLSSPRRTEDGLPDHPLFEEVDFRVVVHQATGMVMAVGGRGASDALALIRAQAFLRNESVTEVALAIVNRTLRIS